MELRSTARYIKNWSRATAKGEIGAKLAGSCLSAPYILSHISPYSRSVHPRTETDMAAFEAPL